MSVRSRRQAREAALAALYQIEHGRQSLDTALEGLEAYQSLPDELRAFAERLARGVVHDRKRIDERIQAHLHDWAVPRLATIDRNILRMACYELFEVEDVPPKVTLDEAIELAKTYSTAESGRFVNGVLGALLAESPKAEWRPPPALAVEEAGATSPEPEPEVVSEDAPEVQELAKVGRWKLRSDQESA